MAEEWERAIQFEDVTLPGSAMAIDHLGMYGNLPELSEASSKWLWHLTICVGTPKFSDSETIIRHATETLELVEKHRPRLLRSIPERYAGTFSGRVLDEWRLALQLMIDAASSRQYCMWIAPLRPDEPNYGRPWQELIAEMRQNMEKSFASTNRDTET